jgi:hypothetical protein
MDLNYVFVEIIMLTYNHHHFDGEIYDRFDLILSRFLLPLRFYISCTY